MSVSPSSPLNLNASSIDAVAPSVDLTSPVVNPPAGNAALGAIAPKERDQLADKAIQWFTKAAGVTVDKPTGTQSRLDGAQQVFLALKEKAENNPSATNVAALTEYMTTMQDVGALGKNPVNYGLPSPEQTVEGITGKPMAASRSMEQLTLVADSDHDGKLSQQELVRARADAQTPAETKAFDAALDGLININRELGEAADRTLSREFVASVLRSKVIDGDFSASKPEAKQQS